MKDSKTALRIPTSPKVTSLKKILCQTINPSQLPYIQRDTSYLSFGPKGDTGCAAVSELALDVKC